MFHFICRKPVKVSCGLRDLLLTVSDEKSIFFLVHLYLYNHRVFGKFLWAVDEETVFGLFVGNCSVIA